MRLSGTLRAVLNLFAEERVYIGELDTYIYRDGSGNLVLHDGVSGDKPLDNLIVPLTTEGDLLVYSSGDLARLPVGSEGQVLQVNGGVPVWQPVTTGTEYPIALTATGTPGDEIVIQHNLNTFAPFITGMKQVTVGYTTPYKKDELSLNFQTVDENNLLIQNLDGNPANYIVRLGK